MSKFYVWIDDDAISSQIQSNTEFYNDNERYRGFASNEVISSKKMNTIIRQSSLITVALMEALAVSNNLTINSSVDDVKTEILNRLDVIKTAVIDEIVNGNMNAVTSNAVYNGLNTKLDKITDAYRIYGTDKNGEQRSYKFSSGNLHDTIMYRSVNGTCDIANPIEPLNIANRQYVDDSLSGRVAKKTAGDWSDAVKEVYFYGIDNSGNEAIFRGCGYAEYSHAATIAIRGTYGLLYSNDIPTDVAVPRALTNRKYVDDGLSGKVDKVTDKQILYGTNEIGEPTNWKFGASSVPNSIMFRGAQGKALISTPTAEDSVLSITNRAYVDDGLSRKVDNVDPTTLPNRVCAYVVDPRDADRKVLAIENEDSCRLGNIVTYLVETNGGNKPNGIGVLLTNTPTKPYQCANKLYVDAQKVYRHLVEFQTSENAPTHFLSVESTSAAAFPSLNYLPNNVPLIAINSGDRYALILQKYGDSFFEIRYASGSWRDSYGKISDYIFVSDTVMEL